MAETAKRRALDFTNVKEGGGINPRRVPAGDYEAKIVEVREETVSSGDNKGEPMWNFVFQLSEHRAATYPYRCTLVPEQLWKVRNVLTACGKTVPKKKINVDPKNMIGSIVGLALEDAEYNDKPKSDIAAIFPASELADTTEPDDEDDAADDGDDADEGDVEDLDAL